MSSNFSIENNSSQWKNYTPFVPYNYNNHYINSLIMNITFAVAGTAINVWFLAAMLLSQEIRTRMRNKIICGILVVNLTETVILCSISAFDYAVGLLEAYHLMHCNIYSVQENIDHIQDFVGNWYIVILLCVFAAQAMNIEPKFPRLRKNILTVVIFISPCVFALLFVPLTMHSYYSRFYDDICVISPQEALELYKYLGTVVPQTLAILLLVMTAVLKRRRYSQRHTSDALQAQLIDNRSQMDPWYPYVALLVTAVASDVSYVVMYMNPSLFFRLGRTTIESVFLAFRIFAYLRVIILPLVLLLFPDIRERIKTWRPCRRSAPPADLVVTYKKNTI